MATQIEKNNDIVMLKSFGSDIDARLALNYLRDNGIETILDNEIFSRIYPIGFSYLGEIRMMVRECDFERAQQLLDELNIADE